MKKTIGFLLCVILIFGACKDDPQPLTGSIVVSRLATTKENVTIGVYDMSVLSAPFSSLLPEYTMMSGPFVFDKVEFPAVNPGDYVVGILYSSVGGGGSHDYQVVQVRAGETTTTGL